MRVADLLGLALSALWQQKLRTLLTTLGVLFGSLVLGASLSVRLGVEEAILREFRRFNDLRRITVHPGFRAVADAAKAAPDVRGVMSEARRERLGRELAQQQQSRVDQRILLTPERLRLLAALEHVHTIDPYLWESGRAFLGERGEHVSILGAPIDAAALRRRLTVGAMPSSAEAHEVLVTEFLLYRLGVSDDADVAAALGKTLRLEYRGTAQAPSLLLTLLHGQRRHGQADEVPAAEEKVLQEVLLRLPEAVAKLDLPPLQRAVADKLFRSPSPRPAVVETFAEDFTLCGVLRSLEQHEQQLPGAWEYAGAEVVLPSRMAQEFYFRVPYHRKDGVNMVTVEVDEPDNVKAVVAQIESMGLRAHSMIPLIEREQFLYRLIFTSMTVVALVALLVACLGITNTMLMSVLERVREIGIMKAVGAREGHIQLIFLVEGALLGLAGGLLGLLLGWAASFPGDAWVREQVNRQLEVRLEESIFVFPWWLVLGVPGFACLVTTLAALLPARRAARVNPIAALRHD